MKTLVFGDIHGRTCWKGIVEKENPDLTIFLGDYVSTHEDISEKQQIDNLKEILKYKEENPDKVILLRGNHDMQACRYSWANCSPEFMSNWLYKNRDEFLGKTQWVYVQGDVVFSHAGISQDWFDDVKKKKNIESIEEINTIEPCGLFGFTPCKMSDYYGTSRTQPLTWIRPEILMDYAIKNKTYVVGHTPQGKIYEFVERKNKFYKENYHISDDECVNDVKIWTCDNLPKEYLVIEDDEFVVKEVE